MLDLLQISLGTTHGLRVSDAWFQRLAGDAGVDVQTVSVHIGLTNALRRGYPVNDLVEAVAARRAAAGAVRRLEPRAVIFSTTTTALVAPELRRPYAVRLDAPAALNRPGARNRPVRVLERRSLAAAALVLATSEIAARALPAGSAPAVIVPPPVVVSGGAGGAEREQLAVAYTPDPKAKGLDLLCRAWSLAQTPPGARLEVFGIEPERAVRHLRRTGVPQPPNVSWRGLAPAEDFHATVARCQGFVTSGRWEDFGMAQLEALALGAPLVCTATDGPFEAREIARRLNPDLVAGDRSPDALAACISRLFSLSAGELDAYRAAAQLPLHRYRPESIARTIAERVVPVLLGS